MNRREGGRHCCTLKQSLLIYNRVGPDVRMRCKDQDGLRTLLYMSVVPVLSIGDALKQPRQRLETMWLTYVIHLDDLSRLLG